jgi:hypothetical protein
MAVLKGRSAGSVSTCIGRLLVRVMPNARYPAAVVVPGAVIGTVVGRPAASLKKTLIKKVQACSCLYSHQNSIRTKTKDKIKVMNKFQEQIAKINATFGEEAPAEVKADKKTPNRPPGEQNPVKKPGKKGRQWYFFKKKGGA